MFGWLERDPHRSDLGDVDWAPNPFQAPEKLADEVGQYAGMVSVANELLSRVAESRPVLGALLATPAAEGVIWCVEVQPLQLIG